MSARSGEPPTGATESIPHGAMSSADGFDAGVAALTGNIRTNIQCLGHRLPVLARMFSGLLCDPRRGSAKSEWQGARPETMKSLNLQLRFLAPLLVTLVAAYFALPLMDRLTLRWFARDLNMRGALVTNTLSDSIFDALSDAKSARLQALFDRAVQDERLFAIGLCSLDGTMLRHTATFPRSWTAGKPRRPRGCRTHVFA